jgi:hypothetical protein
MIFVKGVLVGGATEVQKLLGSGELSRRLAEAGGAANGDARAAAAKPAP